MKTPISLAAAVVISAAAVTPGEALAAPWTFAKTSPVTRYDLAPTARGLDAMPFNVTATGVGSTRVTRMAFMVTGTARTWEVANFQLVYYPDGLSSPGVVVGSTSGSEWKPGPATSIVSIPLATPVTLQGDFAGAFALRVDVNGAHPFFFQPQLQTVTIDDGAEHDLLQTEDLPLPGDTFYVN